MRNACGVWEGLSSLSLQSAYNLADSGLAAQNTGVKILSLGLISAGGRRQMHKQVCEEGSHEGEQWEAGSVCAHTPSM